MRMANIKTRKLRTSKISTTAVNQFRLVRPFERSSLKLYRERRFNRLTGAQIYACVLNSPRRPQVQIVETRSRKQHADIYGNSNSKQSLPTHVHAQVRAWR